MYGADPYAAPGGPARLTSSPGHPVPGSTWTGPRQIHDTGQHGPRQTHAMGMCVPGAGMPQDSRCPCLHAGTWQRVVWSPIGGILGVRSPGSCTPCSGSLLSLTIGHHLTSGPGSGCSWFHLASQGCTGQPGLQQWVFNHTRGRQVCIQRWFIPLRCEAKRPGDTVQGGAAPASTAGRKV